MTLANKKTAQTSQASLATLPRMIIAPHQSSVPSLRAAPKPARPSPDSSTRTHPLSPHSRPQLKYISPPPWSPPQTISSARSFRLPNPPPDRDAATLAPAAPTHYSSSRPAQLHTHPACATRPRPKPTPATTSPAGLRQSQTQFPAPPDRPAPRKA